MSLTDQDREVLLHEIKQIKLALESCSGSRLGIEEEDFEENESDPYLLSGNVEEVTDHDAFLPVNSHPAGPNNAILNSDGPNAADSGNLLAGAARLLSGAPDLSILNNSFSSPSDRQTSTNFTASTPKLSSRSSSPFARRSTSDSNLRASGKALVRKEPSLAVEAALNAAKLVAGLSRPVSRDSSAASSPIPKNDEERSYFDVSVSPSLATPPTQVPEKIKTTNLYVERIFRSFRNKKQLPVSPGSPKNLAALEHMQISSSACLSTLENMLQVNMRYQDIIEDELKKVTVALSNNRQVQNELVDNFYEKDEKTKLTSLSRAEIGRFFNPYFRDSDGQGPPDNEDTLEKRQRTHMSGYDKRTKLWTSEERALLAEGVYKHNLEKKLEPLLHKLRKIDREAKASHKQPDQNAKEYFTQKIADIKALPREVLLKDSKDIDFFKITKNYLPSREEFECRLQWLNMNHPDINQGKFTKAEDAKIVELAKKYENRNWEQIAAELGTFRTPIQCYQRFERDLNSRKHWKYNSNWTEEEDKVLLEAVQLFGPHDWIAIADYVGDRTSNQCMFRWTKTLNPDIRRGYWSKAEDQLLLAAVRKYGVHNWSRVRRQVTGRTDAQCRERYLVALNPHVNRARFTSEEDEKLLRLAAEHPGKWVFISRQFHGRQDGQLYRRYKTLMKRKSGKVGQPSLEGRSPKLGSKKKAEPKPSKNPTKKKRAKNSSSKPANRAVDASKGGKSEVVNAGSKSVPVTKLRLQAKTLGNLHDDFLLQKSSDVLENFKKAGLSYDDARDKLDIFYWVIQQEKSGVNKVVLSEKICSIIEDLEENRRRALVGFESKEAVPSSSLHSLVERPVNGLEVRATSEISSRTMKSGNHKSAHETDATSLVASPERGPDFSLERRTNITTPASATTSSLESSPGVSGTVGSTGRESASAVVAGGKSDASQHLKAFTLLLQALHVDTAGVMNSLPTSTASPSRSTSSGVPVTTVPDATSSSTCRAFSACYPLAPNRATLRAFGTMLMQRSALEEVVRKKYGSDDGTTAVRDTSYKHTRAYQALRSRFHGVFLWPCFMSSFIPKFVLPGMPKCDIPLPPRLSAHRQRKTPCRKGTVSDEALIDLEIEPTASSPLITDGAAQSMPTPLSRKRKMVESPLQTPSVAENLPSTSMEGSALSRRHGKKVHNKGQFTRTCKRYSLRSTPDVRIPLNERGVSKYIADNSQEESD